jgi:heme/copper-type cytochrome/quinol oxidase subunit 2
MAFVYQEISTLSRAARLALWADALVAAAAIALSLTMGAEALTWGDLAQLISVLQLLTWLGSLSLFLIWFYRANANARAMGAEDLMGSPGLSVAWFFVPVAFLFMPYVVVRDTWKASEAPRDWQGRSASPLIGFWWAALLAATITSFIAARIAAEGEYEALGLFALISDIARVAAGLLGAQVVAGIQGQQASPAHLGETFR